MGRRSRQRGKIEKLRAPESEYSDRFGHGSRVKVHVVGKNGAWDRIPAYIRSVVHDPATKDFAGQVWSPSEPFSWTPTCSTPGTCTSA